MRYTKPDGQLTIKTLIFRSGEVAEHCEDKASLNQEKAFPKPLEGVWWKALEEGRAMWKRITDENIREALCGQLVLKAPGPDMLGFKAIRMLWEWDSPRIIALTKTAFRLGIHLQAWKVVRGVVIQKPKKPDYRIATSYRVISLLNCLDKVVGKVAANVIAEECECKRLLHDG